MVVSGNGSFFGIRDFFQRLDITLNRHCSQELLL
jgi:hypothetical protein